MKNKHPDVQYVPTFLKPYVSKDPAELQNLTEPLAVPKPVAAPAKPPSSRPQSQSLPAPAQPTPLPLPQPQPHLTNALSPRVDGILPQQPPLQPIFGTQATILSTPTLPLAPIPPPPPMFTSRDALTILSNASLAGSDQTTLPSSVPRAVLPPPSALLGTDSDPTTVDIQALLQPLSVPTIPLTPATPASPPLAPPLAPPLPPPLAPPNANTATASSSSSSSTQNLLDLLNVPSSSQSLDLLPMDLGLRGSTSFPVDLMASTGGLTMSLNIPVPTTPGGFSLPRILSSAELTPSSTAQANFQPQGWSIGGPSSPGVVIHSTTILPPPTTFSSSPNLVSSPQKKTS